MNLIKIKQEIKELQKFLGCLPAIPFIIKIYRNIVENNESQVISHCEISCNDLNKKLELFQEINETIESFQDRIDKSIKEIDKQCQANYKLTKQKIFIIYIRKY
jgi:tetrahydromethanopterin S-methyltransferase subunit A